MKRGRGIKRFLLFAWCCREPKGGALDLVDSFGTKLECWRRLQDFGSGWKAANVLDRSFGHIYKYRYKSGPETVRYRSPDGTKGGRMVRGMDRSTGWRKCE